MNKNHLNTAERVAKMLLEIKAITLSPRKPYKFVSGIISPIYTDNRLLMGYPLKRKEITVCMANLIKEQDVKPQIIAGTSTAGIPPAAWLADLLDLPMVYVRSGKKDHGKGKQVEGIMKKGSYAVLIEDLISTGKSSLSAIEAIRNEGGKIDTCLAFFDYGFKDTIKKYEDNRINLYVLTTLDIILDVGEKMKLIDQKERKMVVDWQKDPWEWGAKRQAKEKAQPVEYG